MFDTGYLNTAISLNEDAWKITETESPWDTGVVELGSARNSIPYTMAEFKSFVMNNKAFGFHKRVFTPLRDLPTRIIEAIDHSSNSTVAFAFIKNPRRKFFCKCHCWIWRMIDSLFYSSRKVLGSCENSFVNYRINYQKLCDLMRQITKELNWPNGWVQICCKRHEI